MTTKPDVTAPLTAEDFDRWYWPKPELDALCQRFDLPRSGGKDALRARVLHYLATGEVVRPTRRASSGFNWARETLTRETVITDTVSFGPNFRRFMTGEIGSGFRCTGDFMDWVRTHPGETLGAAIDAWYALEARHADPDFQTTIRPHNNYLQYLRDFRAACPDLTQSDAKAAWGIRKSQPIDGERIVFSLIDRELIGR